MRISDVRDLLKDQRVMEEIHRHLWIESQKAGYNIGIEKATDEWLRLYSEAWMKYHMPQRYNRLIASAGKTAQAVKKTAVRKPQAKKKKA